MKIAHIGLATLALASLASASINISGIEAMEGSARYADKPLNNTVKMPSGCITVGEAFDKIEDESGLPVMNKTLIDEKAPICNLDKFDILGDVLTAIIKDNRKIFFTQQDGANYYLVIADAASSVTTFPMYWDTSTSKDLLQKKYPRIKWTFYGNVIKAEGKSADLQEAEKTLQDLRDYAIRVVPSTIRVATIQDESLKHSNEFTNRVRIASKYTGAVDAKVYNVQVSHGNNVQLAGIPVPLKFDLQNNTVTMGNVELPIDELGNVGYLFGDKLVTITFGTLFYNEPVRRADK